jgi:hypothetical protein
LYPLAGEHCGHVEAQVGRLYVEEEQRFPLWTKTMVLLSLALFEACRV